jgi:hypothetical protein
VYLTYTEYKSLGGGLEQADFLRAEFAARMKIDALTGNRLREELPVREAVKMLALELVERGYCGSLDGKDYSSVSNDGRAASFESSRGKAEALIKDFLANETLGGEPLLPARPGIQYAKALRV